MSLPQHANILIFEVFAGERLVTYTLDASDAQMRADEKRSKCDDVISVVQRHEMVNVIQGEMLGRDPAVEAVHIVFQFPCGKWSSEDYELSDPDTLLVRCGCKVCKELYSIVSYEK
jgi:hypothetical protein